MNFEAARKHLLDDGADVLITFMAAKSVPLLVLGDMDASRATAIDLGWIDPATELCTRAGVLASDSCREYVFWQQRGGQLPFENALPHLDRATFAGKAVCEIGAGMGANLMSLASTTTALCGVEPVAAYVQMGDIFREREGMPPVDIRDGAAEALPFDADTLDLVLLVSAHQYFDIRIALAEIARVLRPGGELVLIGGTLPTFVRDIGPAAMRGATSRKGFAITVANTLGYMAAGRRIIPSRGGFSTSQPVYPTRAAMVRWMRVAGLEQVVPPDHLAGETCFYATLKQG